MIKIGITGGIGSGKTTVCEIWQKQGAQVVYADDLAKYLMQDNKSVRQQISETFGEESYQPNGDLNRAYLADKAFNKGRVEELNSIVHPAVFKETDRLITQAEKDGYDVFVYEAAILLHHGQPEKFDHIVMVLADERKRITRVGKRDKANENDVLERIRNQQNFESLISMADVVIRNNGSLRELEKEAIKVYKTLTRE